MSGCQLASVAVPCERSGLSWSPGACDSQDCALVPSPGRLSLVCPVLHRCVCHCVSPVCHCVLALFVTVPALFVPVPAQRDQWVPRVPGTGTLHRALGSEVPHAQGTARWAQLRALRVCWHWEAPALWAHGQQIPIPNTAVTPVFLPYKKTIFCPLS